MARILLVHPGPDFSVADVHRGWEKALRGLGHTVMTYNTNDRLTYYGHALMPKLGELPCEACGQTPVYKALDNDGIMQLAMDGLYECCYKFWPQVIFFVSAFYTHPAMLQLLRTRRHKIVMLHTESPYEDERQMERGQFADLNLVNDPVNIEAWRELEVPVAYMAHSYDPDIHYPDPDPRRFEADFAFIGTAFDSRQEFFGSMDFEGIDVVFGGGNWNNLKPQYVHLAKYLGHHPEACVDNEETARVYRLARCGINFYRREADKESQVAGWAMGPREVEMAACGLFFLRDSRPESDEVFGEVLPLFSSPREASDLLRWWLAHDDEREERARQAYQRIADRTFINHARTASTKMEEAGIL